MGLARQLAFAALLGACAAPNFSPPSLVQSVRVLATAADKPYAAPGDTVNMQVLAFDGRATKPEPMGVWWIPQPCFNPPGDAYYACFGSFSGTYISGVDITSKLSAGTAFAFQVPGGIISLHHGSRGGAAYGLAVVFTVACAGHVEYLNLPPRSPADAVPFGCFDSSGAQLGSNDFIFAYSLVYSFMNRTNANPVIQAVTFGGVTIDPNVGITVARCTQSDIKGCPATPLDVLVPDSSDEVDPGDLDANGNPLKEQIYVDYYLSAGKVDHDSIILFDPRAGRLPNTSDSFYAPQSAGEFLVWAVIHDNRGGVSWMQLPVHAR